MKLDELIIESRRNQIGKSLPETGYQFKKVKIYRALDANMDYFLPEDYITLSLKFAKGHAESNMWVEEETQKVISMLVNAEDVFEATNPGEYFWMGKKIKGRTEAIFDLKDFQ